MKFAKLLELKDGGQVLVTIDPDEDSYIVSTRTDFAWVTATLKFGFDNEDDAIKMLESYGLDEAETFRSDMRKNF